MPICMLPAGLADSSFRARMLVLAHYRLPLLHPDAQAGICLPASLQAAASSSSLSSMQSAFSSFAFKGTQLAAQLSACAWMGASACCLVFRM